MPHDAPYLLIPVSPGRFTKVSPEDAHLADDNWTSHTTPAGHTYASRSVKRNGRWVKELMHRVITGAEKGEVVDHVGENSLDNRRRSLKVCSQRANILRAYPDAGIRRSPTPGKWLAYMSGKYLGTFETHAEAKAHRQRLWDREVYG